jgi:GT2 family glycosyltransferase
VALAEGAQAVVLLNVDTVLARDWLAHLALAAAQRPAAHILQSKILLQGTNRLNSLGNRIHFLGYGYCAGHGRQEGWQVSGAMHFASGASMLIKREVFERIGLFREDYFLYGEDLEFCWRAQLAGFNLGLVEESVCHHRYRFRRQPELIFLRERNRWTTLLTLPRRRTLLVLAPCLLVSQLLLCAYGLGVGWGGGVWRLLRHFSRPSTWRQLRLVRRQVQQLRVRSDAEIVRGFAGTIEFPDFGGFVLRCVLNPCLQAYWWVARRLIVW